MQVGVLGAGSWGTALAHHLAKRGHGVRLWAFEPTVADDINRNHLNSVFLPDSPLHRSLSASPDVSDVVSGADLIVSASPSHAARSVANQVGRALAGATPVIVSVSKGLEPETLLPMTQVLNGIMPESPVVALSGPSFAVEVYAGMPTAVVAASASMEAAQTAQAAFSTPTFRVYTGEDVIGVEIGGALKNVVAIAAGIVDGLGLGNNARAALITRGLAEMTRLGEAMGASPRTFAGLAGLGDLILTSTGGLSRNRSLGIALGEGKTLDQALRGKKTVAEGVNTARVAVKVAAREGVEMPIATEVTRILFEDKPPSRAISDLMERELKAEL